MYTQCIEAAQTVRYANIHAVCVRKGMILDAYLNRWLKIHSPTYTFYIKLHESQCVVRASASSPFPSASQQAPSVLHYIIPKGGTETWHNTPTHTQTHTHTQMNQTPPHRLNLPPDNNRLIISLLFDSTVQSLSWHGLRFPKVEQSTSTLPPCDKTRTPTWWKRTWTVNNNAALALIRVDRKG